MNPVGGIVLAGGQSTRMGRPKAWLPFAGEIMLPRVVRILGEVVRPIVVVAAPGQDLPPLPGDILIARDETPGRGPLEGLAAGLAALTGKAEAAYVSSCDVPLLQPAFIRRLIELLGEYEICVPFVEDRFHPLAAVYRLGTLAAVKQLLQLGETRPRRLLPVGQTSPSAGTDSRQPNVRTRIVSAAELEDVDPGLRSLWNVNTPRDYEKAAQVTALSSSPET